MSHYILKDFPDPSALLFDFRSRASEEILQVNSHVHTPYSFSAFNSIENIFLQAEKEKVRILGINDFFIADGFREFYQKGLQEGIFPMFNIEIVALMVREQYDRFRINDPENPGRTYLSGKGLDYPFHLDELLACRIQNASREIQIHLKEVIEKASQVIQEIDPGLSLKYSEVKRVFAREFVTERHISRAIRSLIFERFKTPAERRSVMMNLFGLHDFDIDLGDKAGVENEIRSKFLKSGGRAFIPEEPSAFIAVSEALQIILNAGGIPCYSVLLDNEEGLCTEYEANKQILLNELLTHNIHCIEFLPARNNADVVRDYAQYFRENGFLILFGTAHSTPEEKPLRVCTRSGQFLDGDLAALSYEGAGVIAAHQYLRARGETGYLDDKGMPRENSRKEFEALGKAVIHRFIHSSETKSGK